MDVLQSIKGGLIVSCQALPEEPLHSPFIMGRMAYAAMLGGAKGIRANSCEDIREIKKNVSLPVIGIIKADYPNCSVYITPTMGEVDALVECDCEIIATDATNRPRPGGLSLAEFFAQARAKYPGQLFMADCSTYEEGMAAAEMGFDLIGTTLSGYTEYTKGAPAPDFKMMGALVKNCGKPVIAEGNIWTHDNAGHSLYLGVHAVVVGSAITRPMLITKGFADVMEKCINRIKVPAEPHILDDIIWEDLR